MIENHIRIVTYNIHKGFDSGNRRFILHQIREALREIDADVLFLQEMQGEHLHKHKSISNWPNSAHYEFLAEEFWPYSIYGKNAVYAAGHHGNAILSKYPFSAWENINVSPFSWASRSMLHGVIRLQNGVEELHLICIHFGLLAKERRLQIGKLCERIEMHVPKQSALIIAGDFNDWLVQAEELFQERLGLHEIFLESHGQYARTFPSWLPFLQMDRIYSRGLALIQCERLDRMPWRSLSDHVPLTAHFRL
jgi:endonuclease/exonuclease/phosphatase family metal-dependent hydrolase